MIQVNNVDFAYKKGRLIFENLTMKFEPGSIYGLLGKNGSGKTSLMKLISGLRYPKTGNISIDGIDSVGRSPEYLSKYFLIPEEFDFPSITIESFVKLYSPFYTEFEFSQFEHYLSEFEVAQNSIITKLSLGQKKKFLLAFGLACNTEVMLMDEPTNGLDIPSKVQFRKILAGLADTNKAFIISTHQIKDIEEIVDHISIIHHGQLRFSSAIDGIIENLVFSEKQEHNESEILYEEKHFGSTRIVGKNIDNQYTTVDLELLFNAVLVNDKKIKEIFDKNKIENHVTV